MCNRQKYYCRVFTWWVHYGVPVSLFACTLLVLEYYSERVVRRSVNDRTRVSTASVTGFISTGESMFFVNAADEICHTYYIYNLKIDILSGSLFSGMLKGSLMT